MSLEHFSKALYQDLPSQNLGFVEGGVLIYPSMIGLTLPTDMQERDLYIYLSLYTTVMDKLAMAENENEGKSLVEDTAKELDVSKDKFEKDTGKIYMLECLIANKVLPTSFNQIQTVFKTQRHRANQLLNDIQSDVDETAKDIGEKLKNKVALRINSVNNTKEVESVHQPPDTTPAQLPAFNAEDYSGANQFALGTVEEPPPNEEKEEKGFLSTAKDYATKPPVLIGGAVVSYLLLNKFVFSKPKNEVPRKRNKKRRSKKRSKNGWRS
jgi:hypothetical protein